jgi:hypothetical protein
VLGPAPLFRLRGRERAQIVIKAAERALRSPRSARRLARGCTATSRSASTSTRSSLAYD